MDTDKYAAKKYNAFISWEAGAVDRGVEAVDGKIRQGKKTPLAGMLFALADNICTEGINTTCASRIMDSYKPPFGHSAIPGLMEQGALLAGKTNMDEFGRGASGVNSCFGAIKNPWNIEHTAGNGAAAVVACGAVSLALGSDTCGELRQAASYCGVIGLKPTYGRVSRKGLIGWAPSLEQVGIIAGKTVDLAAALETIGGHDPQDPTSASEDVPAYTLSLLENADQAEHIKIAVPENWSQYPGLEPDARQDFIAALDRLIKSGFQVDTIVLPNIHHSLVTSAIISAVEAFSSLSNYDGVRFGFRKEGGHLQDMYRLTRTNGFGRALKQFLTFGALISAGEYYNDYFVKAQKMRTLIKKEMEECLQQYDLIVSPAVPFRAPLLRKGHNGCLLPDPAAAYTAAANLAGLPALTIPAQPTNVRDGLPPVGLQLMGKAWDELTILRAALILEKNNPLKLCETDTF